MMKTALLKSLIISFVLLCLSTATGYAQTIADPTDWNYEVKKKSDTLYELLFSVHLREGWHMWSINPGGDGLQIPPSFQFDSNSLMHTQSALIENGTKHSIQQEGIDGIVHFYDGTVTYTQIVSVKAPTTITGTHLYQVCNDHICLPPTTKKFKFVVD